MMQDWLTAAEFLESRGFADAASALRREYRIQMRDDPIRWHMTPPEAVPPQPIYEAAKSADGTMLTDWNRVGMVDETQPQIVAPFRFVRSGDLNEGT